MPFSPDWCASVGPFKKRKVAGLIPGHSACVGCRPGPGFGACERQPINVYLYRQHCAPSIPPPLSKNKSVKSKKEREYCPLYAEVPSLHPLVKDPRVGLRPVGTTALWNKRLALSPEGQTKTRGHNRQDIEGQLARIPNGTVLRGFRFGFCSANFLRTQISKKSLSWGSGVERVGHEEPGALRGAGSEPGQRTQTAAAALSPVADPPWEAEGLLPCWVQGFSRE